MNFTAIEKKHINIFNNVSNINNNNKKINLIETNKLKKIEPKKLGIKNIMGSINPLMKSNNIKINKISNNTISLKSKLEDISEKLDKYENLINKFGKEFQ